MPVCPLRVRNGASVFIFQTMIFLSREAEAKSPDSNTQTHVMPPVCFANDFFNKNVPFSQILIVKSSEAETKSLFASSAKAVISFEWPYKVRLSLYELLSQILIVYIIARA